MRLPQHNELHAPEPLLKVAIRVLRSPLRDPQTCLTRAIRACWPPQSPNRPIAENAFKKTTPTASETQRSPPDAGCHSTASFADQEKPGTEGSLQHMAARRAARKISERRPPPGRRMTRRLMRVQKIEPKQGSNAGSRISKQRGLYAIKPHPSLLNLGRAPQKLCTANHDACRKTGLFAPTSTD